MATFDRGALEEDFDAAVATLKPGTMWMNKTPDGTQILAPPAPFSLPFDGRVWKYGDAGVLGSEQFPVDVLSAGGGVSPNMNVNEVIANRANELLSGRRGYEFVHPNNHVNAGQSTSDAMATALNVALYRDIHRLRDAVGHLADVLEEKIEEHRDTVKLSRTCLQDATRSQNGSTR